MRASVSREGPESSRLTVAAGAYKKAQQLHDAAGARLHQVVVQAKRHEAKTTRVVRRPVSPEIISAVALVRNPASVRQAFMASIVLGPPRGLEN